MRTLTFTAFLLVHVAGFSLATLTVKAEGYSLRPALNENVTSTVSVSLEVGGDLLTTEEGVLQSQPTSATAELVYHERLVKWSADAKAVARSVRQYEQASATIKGEEESFQRTLSAERRQVVAEIRDGHVTVNTLVGELLSREQFDLLNVMGNSLALDRLLPGRDIAEGEGWDHDQASIAPLLDMDHVAVCEVRSVVTGESHNQVQIRMAGTVHGTIDGAPTEIDLRGAYLFHLDRRRITKFNLAIREKRTANEVVPGLDIVAQVKLTIARAARDDRIDDELVALAGNTSKPLRRELLYDRREHGFRLLHDTAWYLTGEQSDLVSLRYLHEGESIAHCNVSTLSPRSAGRETTLDEFERDVRASIGEHLEKVTASRKWTTPRGNSCLGVIASGKVEEMPVQWRFYLVSAPDMPRVSLALTVEQSLIEKFADADRQLIDSLELIPSDLTSTAARVSGRASH